MNIPVFFYAPELSLDSDYLKTDIGSRWLGNTNNFYGWVVRTYSYLKNAGFDCEITNKIPENGIMIADRDTLGKEAKFFPEVMVICPKGDRDFHPSAHLHIVQNSCECDSHPLWNASFIPYWIQPDLIPRRLERGSLVENIAFIGAKSQLAPEFKSASWSQQVNDLECHWLPIHDKKLWNDYSNIDIILAARDFKNNTYLNKPASKLINAWIAGVPAVLSRESAFMNLINSELDFIPINSPEEAIEAIKMLKFNSELYQLMIENGLKRCQEYSDRKTIERWLDYFEKIAFPNYYKWMNISLLEKKTQFLKRLFLYRLIGLKSRLKLSQ